MTTGRINQVAILQNKLNPRTTKIKDPSRHRRERVLFDLLKTMSFLLLNKYLKILKPAAQPFSTFNIHKTKINWMEFRGMEERVSNHNAIPIKKSVQFRSNAGKGDDVLHPSHGLKRICSK
jgi:hypothetical protein